MLDTGYSILDAGYSMLDERILKFTDKSLVGVAFTCIPEPVTRNP